MLKKENNMNRNGPRKKIIFVMFYLNPFMSIRIFVILILTFFISKCFHLKKNENKESI